MSYADRVGNSKPACWGNANTYDPKDEECADCKYQHTCRSEIEREKEVRDNRRYERVSSFSNSRPSYSNYPNRRPEYSRNDREDEDLAPRYDPDLIGSHERPVDRFFKNCAAGGLRGVFYEGYQFWKRFRFR